VGRGKCGVPGDGDYTHFHFFDGIGPAVGDKHTGVGNIQRQHNWDIRLIVCHMAGEFDHPGIDWQPANVEH
jgi:hypothetical protein